MANVPGLMNSTALTPPGAPPTAPQDAPTPADDDGGDGSDGEAASPQEEAQMEQFLAQCKMLIYSRKTPQTTQAIIQSLKAGNDPVKALANVALNVAQRVEASANQAGEQIDPAVLLQGGFMIVKDIADFSEQISKGQGTPVFTDKQVQQAYLMAVDMYRTQKQKSGDVNEGEAKQEWGSLVQADQSGQLDKVLPGADAAAKELGPAATEAAPQADSAAPKAAAPGLSKKKKRRRR